MSPCLLVCLSATALYLLVLHRLADRDLWSSHEARAGQDARTILADGTWLVPRLFDGRWEVQKPPLYYWAVAGLARLRGSGVDAWDVRLPAALSAIGCVAVLAWLGRMRGRLAMGLAAATVLATSVHFTWLARIARVDMPLTLSVCVSLCSLYLAHQRPSQRFLLLPLAYGAMAAGVLLKGPIAVVLPLAVVAIWLVVEADAPTLLGRLRLAITSAFRDLGFLAGGAFVAAVMAAWFVSADGLTDGELFREFVWHHNLERGLGGSRLRSHPWWFYGPQFFIDLLPWSPLMLLAAVWCVRSGRWRHDPEMRFGLVWLLTIVLILSCSRYKRADYLLPAYPGAALFLASALLLPPPLWRRVGGRSGNTFVPPPPPSPTRGEGEREEPSPAREEGERSFRPLLIGGGVIAALTVSGWLVRLEHQLPAQESFRDYRSFAAIVREHAPAPRPVVFFRTEAHALAFHVGRPLDVLVQWPDLRAALAAPGPHYVVLPPPVLAEWAAELPGIAAAEVARNTDPTGRHERPLVLVRIDP